MSLTTKIRCKKLIDSVYKRDIYLVIGDYEDVNPYLKRRFGCEEVTADEDEAQFIEHDGKYFFWLSSFDDSPNAFNSISHEVTHAVWQILSYLGLEYSDSSEEAFCYYAGSLTEQIVKFARK